MNIVRLFLNTSSRWYYPLHWLGILALGLVVYYRAFGCGFVFDDNAFIITNPYIKHFSRINEVWAFFPMTRLVGMYSFTLNYFTNQLHPFGYHLFNFIVHLIATALVWGTAALLFKITRKEAPADALQQELPFIMALLFLVHPGQTQAVTYISQRFESMAAVFYLATVYTYLSARVSPAGIPRIRLFVLAGMLALLGILTKETAVTLPVTIIAIEFIFWHRSLRIPLILLGVGILFGLVFMNFVHAGLNILFNPILSESHEGDVLTPLNYFLTQMRVFLTFVRLLIFPVNQNLDYDYPMSTGLLSPPLTLIGMAVIGAFIFSVIRLRRTRPLIAFGLAWMLITFSINLVPRANVIFEHKLYLISFGFFLAAVTALPLLIRSPRVLTGVFAGVIAVLSLVTFQRNQVWQSEMTVWQDIARKSPGKWRAFANLGTSYGMVHRNEEGIAMLDKAIAMNPQRARSYLNRGIIYDQLGVKDKALEDINKAIELDPRYFIAYIKRASFYRARNDFEPALADLARAIKLQPNFQDAYIERGLLWIQLNSKEEAIADFQRALAIAPYDYGALIDRGAMYFLSGRYEEALADFTLAERVDPTREDAFKNRAYCLLQMGRTPEALKDFAMAVRLNPNDVPTRRKYEEVFK